MHIFKQSNPRILSRGALAAGALGAIWLAGSSMLPHLATEGAHSSSFGGSPISLGSTMGDTSRGFVENRGQWDLEAQFLAKTPGLNIWITKAGLVYDFYRVGQSVSPGPNARQSTPGTRQGQAVTMEFVGANASAVKGDRQLQGRFNYFIGGDRSGWTTNVPMYAEVRSERIYDGVEARWYFDHGVPRYDLIVAPGADVAKIALRFGGANGLSTDGQVLRIRTRFGPVEHRGLFAYQQVEGKRQQVACAFRVKDDVVTFSAGAYNERYPLVIDPLLWSTFLGGGGGDFAFSVAKDSAENPVIVGMTLSTTFPTVAGSYDVALGGGNDAFVSKLSADGSTLLFSSYLGGPGTSGIERAYGVAIDTDNTIAVAGETGSAGFPTTAGAFDRTFNSGGKDAFAAKLSADGSSLMLSTLLGGSSSDSISATEFDSLGNLVLAGFTQSTDFPTTALAFDTILDGAIDAFIARLSGDGTSLVSSTFLGGTGSDSAQGLAIDSADNAIVTGYTLSAGFPTTPGAFDRTHGGGLDAFVAKLPPSGSTLTFSTFVGGTGDDTGWSVALDSQANVVVGGETRSSNFPVTPGAFSTVLRMQQDAFVAKLSPDGSSVSSATFLGGYGAKGDIAYDVAIDSHDNALVAGATYSSDFPTTEGAYDRTYSSDADVFFARVSPDSSKLLYGTYLGGSMEDKAFGVCAGVVGAAFVVGHTFSSAFPSTPGAFDTTYAASPDGFVANLKTSGSTFFKLSPTSGVGGILGATGVITLTNVAPAGGREIFLESSNPTRAEVPPSFTIQEGEISKTFLVRTHSVSSTTEVLITARLGSQPRTLALRLFPGGLANLAVSPSTVIGGTSTTGTVFLSGKAPRNGREVSLSSSLGAKVPKTVTVPSGATSANFTITTSTVAATKTVTIKASAGYDSRSAKVTLSPN